jgi:hypothetical protein
VTFFILPVAYTVFEERAEKRAAAAASFPASRQLLGADLVAEREPVA